MEEAKIAIIRAAAPAIADVILGDLEENESDNNNTSGNGTEMTNSTEIEKVSKNATLGIVKIRPDHASKSKMRELANGTIICPDMFVRFTNVYYFTTIVTTAVGYGAQYVGTEQAQIFLIFFALIAIPYTNFCLSRLTLGMISH